MHIFITIFALTYGQMDLFFSTKGAIITEAFSHTFLHDLLKIPQPVCHLSYSSPTTPWTVAIEAL